MMRDQTKVMTFNLHFRACNWGAGIRVIGPIYFHSRILAVLILQGSTKGYGCNYHFSVKITNMAGQKRDRFISFFIYFLVFLIFGKNTIAMSSD